MKLSIADIEVLCAEVHQACAGGQVQKIWGGRATEVLFRVRVPGRNHLLLLAAGDTAARLHLASARTGRGAEPSAFVALLRKHLIGARLVAIEQTGRDRLASLQFVPPVRSLSTGERLGTSIVAELTGRHGNVFLLDENGTILGSLRTNVSFRRKLVPHQPYLGPESRPREEAADIRSELPESGASAVVEAAIEQRLAAEEDSALRTQAERTVRKALRKTRTRVQRVTRDLERASGAEELQRWAQLLQSAYGKVARGAAEVQVVDYYDPDQSAVLIPLDPAMSLESNIQRYFKNAKRLKGAQKFIEKRLAAAVATQERLENALDAIGSSDDPDTVVENLRSDGVLPRQRFAGSAKKKSDVRLPYHRFSSKTGLPILVGRSAKDNQELTFRVARGNDLWLHVDGAGGAHVVVKLPKRTQVDGDTLLDAATLAAFYSRRKNDTQVDVRYARQAEVRKPKGSPTGTVTVVRSRVVPVRMEDDRIRRLMDSRE